MEPNSFTLAKRPDLISAVVAEALVRSVLAILAVVAVTIEAVQVSERRNSWSEKCSLPEPFKSETDQALTNYRPVLITMRPTNK